MSFTTGFHFTSAMLPDLAGVEPICLDHRVDPSLPAPHRTIVLPCRQQT